MSFHTLSHSQIIQSSLPGNLHGDTIQFMVFEKTITAYSEIQTKPKHMFCQQNTKLLNFTGCSTHSYYYITKI